MTNPDGGGGGAISGSGSGWTLGPGAHPVSNTAAKIMRHPYLVIIFNTTFILSSHATLRCKRVIPFKKIQFSRIEARSPLSGWVCVNFIEIYLKFFYRALKKYSRAVFSAVEHAVLNMLHSSW